MKINNLSDTTINIILMLFVLLITYPLSDLSKDVGMLNIIYAVLIVMVVFAFAAWVVLEKYNSKLEARIFKSLNEFVSSTKKEHIDFVNNLKLLTHEIHNSVNLTNASDWLMTTQQLVDLEAREAKSDVWIVTSDLEEDSLDGPFYKTIKSNLNRGVTYRYFLPNSNKIVSRVDRLRNSLDEFYNKTLFFHHLDDDFFFLISQFDFGIINPSECYNMRFGFMGITAPGVNKIRFQVKISDHLIDEIVGKLKPYTKL